MSKSVREYPESYDSYSNLVKSYSESSVNTRSKERKVRLLKDDSKDKLLMFSNIYRVFVACGMLVMPHAISLSGVIPSLIIVIVVSFLTTVNHNYMQRVCRALRISPGVTLETVSGRICGSSMKNLILIIISASQLCAFIGSFVLSTDLIHHSLCGSKEVHEECTSRWQVACVLAIFNIVMVFIPNLKTFGYISSFSVFFQFFALSCVFYSACKLITQREAVGELLFEETMYFNWANSGKTLGIVLYIFQRVTFYLPIKSSYSRMKGFHKFYIASMNMVFGYIFLISLPCFFQFFTDGKEILFQNFDHSFRTIEFFKIAYVVVIFLSNPINLFPIYNSLYMISFLNSFIEKRNKVGKYMTKVFIRLLITCFGVIIGTCVTSFVKFCSFVGAFFFSFLGLVLPGLLLLKLETVKKCSRTTIGRCLVLGVGIAIFLTTTFESVRDLIFSEVSSI